VRRLFYKLGKRWIGLGVSCNAYIDIVCEMSLKPSNMVWDRSPRSTILFPSMIVSNFAVFQLYSDQQFSAADLICRCSGLFFIRCAILSSLLVQSCWWCSVEVDFHNSVSIHLFVLQNRWLTSTLRCLEFGNGFLACTSLLVPQRRCRARRDLSHLRMACSQTSRTLKMFSEASICSRNFWASGRFS
jgi:hypothetical protein